MRVPHKNPCMATLWLIMLGKITKPERKNPQAKTSNRKGRGETQSKASLSLRASVSFAVRLLALI
jgi:hypothetical protein